MGDKLFLANARDSGAVIAVKVGSRVLAEDLSSDQTPCRRDEYERVKLSGARVLSVDQVEGPKDPSIQTLEEEETEGEDALRLGVLDGMYPGTAFARSIGDSTAEEIGMVANPKVSVVRLTPDHLFFIIASDDVFEFLLSHAVVDMVASYSDPRDACAAIAGESSKLWLEHQNRTDDITIIIVIVHSKDLSHAGANGTGEKSRLDIRSASFRIRKWSCSSSVTSAFEVFLSIRSEYADKDTNGRSQIAISNARNSAIVVPPPPRALQLMSPGKLLWLIILVSAQKMYKTVCAAILGCKLIILSLSITNKIRFHHSCPFLYTHTAITTDEREEIIGRAHVTTAMSLC